VAVRKNEYIFPATRENKPISDALVSAVLKRMGQKNITQHAFDLHLEIGKLK